MGLTFEPGDGKNTASGDYSAMSPYRAVIEFMTNHERNQWARAGYPGQHNGNPDGPKAFIADPERLALVNSLIEEKV